MGKRARRDQRDVGIRKYGEESQAAFYERKKAQVVETFFKRGDDK